MENKARIRFTDADGVEHLITMYQNSGQKKTQYHDKNISPSVVFDILDTDKVDIGDGAILPYTVGSVISGEDGPHNVILCLTTTATTPKWRNISNPVLMDIWPHHLVEQLTNLTIEYDAKP